MNDVRTTPLIGDKAWFGPRRVGWGLSPITIEGWIVTAGLLGLAAVAARRWPANQLARSAPSIGLVAIALAKGTAPGGRRARAALHAPESPEASPSLEG